MNDPLKVCIIDMTKLAGKPQQEQGQIQAEELRKAGFDPKKKYIVAQGVNAPVAVYLQAEWMNSMPEPSGQQQQQPAEPETTIDLAA